MNITIIILVIIINGVQPARASPASSSSVSSSSSSPSFIMDQHDFSSHPGGAPWGTAPFKSCDTCSND
jgi:hypothetical protein